MLYFLFSDETNLQPSKVGRFFIYGGIFVPAENMMGLHALVQSARDGNSFKPQDEFKCSERPEHVAHEQFTLAKKAVLEGCIDLGVKFAACLTLHQIAAQGVALPGVAAKRKTSLMVQWGANTILEAFNRFLQEENAHGICVLDRLPIEQDSRFMKEKFQTGFSYPNGGTKKADRILMYSTSCIGASHAMSAADIILGSFRYCVNETNKTIVPTQMLPIIVRMMWHRVKGNTIYLRERGLLFRPREVKMSTHKQQYDDLVKRLEDLLKLGNVETDE